ncbi:MAG TPA: O-antigen ligase family protein [Pyrinomonadaceae bacterium]|jgi:O-antigen ligase|nr:O-antigen ligase family protein [Pyrinomonadaceae bacterium]
MLRLLRQFSREPHRAACVLWPLALLAPFVPGLPRPSNGGITWRQELTVSLLLALTFFLIPRRRRRPHPPEPPTPSRLLLLPLALFAAWGALSALWATNVGAALHYGLTWGLYLLFFVAASRAVYSPRLLRDALALLAFAAVVMSAANVICHFGAEVSLPRLNGLNEPVAVLIPLFVALALTLRRRRAALLCGAAAVTGWLSVLQIAERAHFFAIVGALLLLALMMCASRRFRPRSLARAVVLAALFAACLGLQVNPSFFHKTGRDSVIVRLRQTSVADPSARARLLYWAAAFEMLRAHPVNGVGGGGYDSAFAEARAAYAVREPESPLLGVNERYLMAGAHNEYLQIASELGLVGVGLFAVFCVALVWGAWRALRAGRGPLVPGAVASLAVFAVCSGASSISFRWFGSGLAFFFAAAVVQRFAGLREQERKAVPASIGRPARRAYGLGLAFCLVAALAMCVQAAGVMVLSGAQAASDPARAERLYRSALALNPLDAGAHFNYGMWLFSARREREAVPHLRYALGRGFSASTCYGYLAAAESLAGDLAASARTLEEGARVYPRSVFLRVRLASALRRLGRADEAELEIGRATLIDSRAARGWHELIDNDIDAAIAAARRDGRQVAMPGELQPEDGVRAVIEENARRFPEAAASGWRARLRHSLAQ